MIGTKKIVEIAWKDEFVIPAFNIPYLPMVKPIVSALCDEDSFGLIQVARLEWIKFESGSMKQVADQYRSREDVSHVRIHLDHIPVIDEDGLHVDYLSVIKEAISLGYQSLMIDGSRLPLADNIEATKEVCDMAHQAGLPCEAELGSVFGHETNSTLSYDEIFNERMGFTKTDEAQKFVEESGCDWLSVAFGNIHGAISKVARKKKKPQAKLDISHLKLLKEATGIPLVLHGGSGIEKKYIEDAVKNGIAKINIASELRQQYEQGIAVGGVKTAADMVYEKTREILRDFLGICGTANIIRQYGQE